MRQAIARKNDLLSRIHDYRYDAYIKFIVRDLAKDRDSAESVFLITETQTTAYWEQPDKYQEVISARQQSSNLPAENNLVSVGQILNFNTNRIDLQKYSVVSPTADDALDHYRYHLLDTLYISERTVFRLAIEPKSDAAPLFVGMIDVADSTFDVLAVDVGANEAIRFDFFENMRYRQRLRDFGEDHWMPEEIHFSGELHVGVPLPGFPEHISFEHAVTLDNFRFDAGDAPATLGEYLVVVDEGADDVDSTSWEEQRSAPLSEVEHGAYTRIDSIENRPRAFGSKLLTGALGTIALSSNPDFFRFNRVEAAYLGAGWTWRNLSPDLILRARLGYSFGREDWQQRYGAQYRLSEGQRLWVGGTYQEQIVSRPTIVSAGSNPTYLALFAKFDPLDYYREKGASFFVSTKLVNFTRLRLQYNDFRQSSAEVVTDYSIFDDEKLQRPNTPIVDGTLRSLSGSISFDSRPLLKQAGRDYYFNSFTYTQLSLGAEYASPSFIKNDFDFLRVFVRLWRRQRTLNMGLTTINAVAGISSGDLPPQRYFTVDFGRGAFVQPNSFTTMNETNFSGNRAAMVYLNHNFDQQLFRRSRIPLLREIPFTVSVHGGVFWTDFVDHTANPSDADVHTAPSAYSEIGFGIGNLTPMIAPFNFAVSFTWQLSSYETDRFEFRLGVPTPGQ